jgi:hypothetical protein
VKLIHTNRPSERAALITEAVVAMAMLTIAVLPLAFSFHHERTLLKASYYRAIAMEVVDGEMEILTAAEWRSFPSGQQTYAVRAGAATNLPPGQFQLTINSNRVRLAWQPSEAHSGGAVIREASVK